MLLGPLLPLWTSKEGDEALRVLIEPVVQVNILVY